VFDALEDTGHAVACLDKVDPHRCAGVVAWIGTPRPGRRVQANITAAPKTADICYRDRYSSCDRAVLEGDTRAVMDVMEWSKIDMAQRYMHVPDELRQRIASQAPLLTCAPEEIRTPHLLIRRPTEYVSDGDA
jgi:threonine dehydrogenase-like Zn-dependent dehydrogenase